MKDISWQNVLAPGLPSGTIAYFGAGGVSHSDVLDEEGWLWGARSDRVRDYTRPGSPRIPAGFQRRPPNYCRWIKRKRYTLRVSNRQYDRFWRFTRAQEGKPYDPYAIACFAFPWLARNRNWRDDSYWFCSEEQAAAAEHAGIVMLDELHHWITPGGWGLVLCGARARVEHLPLVWPPAGAAPAIPQAA